MHCVAVCDVRKSCLLNSDYIRGLCYSSLSNHELGEVEFRKQSRVGKAATFHIGFQNTRSERAEAALNGLASVLIGLEGARSQRKGDNQAGTSCCFLTLSEDIKGQATILLSCIAAVTQMNNTVDAIGSVW